LQHLAPIGVMAAGAIAPSLATCALYAALTAIKIRPRPPEALAAPPPPKPPTPRAPSPFAPVVLAEPPTTARLIQIFTWPEERIGQRLFMYAIQLWTMAASVWFALPFVLGGWLGLDQDTKLMIAALGWCALFWSAFCTIANRLHDLGLGAVWALAPAAAALVWLVQEGPPAQGWYSMTTLVHWIIASVLCYGALAAFLLTRKGDPLPNRYGAESS
jgi:uncharacterized membrane protein YhaH (DUF805 family)